MNWEKRNTIELGRAKEFVEIYESLGLEVKVEPMDLSTLDDDLSCNKCYIHGQENFVTIFTRPLKENGDIT